MLNEDSRSGVKPQVLTIETSLGGPGFVGCLKTMFDLIVVSDVRTPIQTILLGIHMVFGQRCSFSSGNDNYCLLAQPSYIISYRFHIRSLRSGFQDLPPQD